MRDTRKVIITLQSPLMNDGDQFDLLVDHTLLEYVDMIQYGEAGNEAQEHFISSKGITLTTVAANSPVCDIPRAEPHHWIRERRPETSEGSQSTKHVLLEFSALDRAIDRATHEVPQVAVSLP